MSGFELMAVLLLGLVVMLAFATVGWPGIVVAGALYGVAAVAVLVRWCHRARQIH